ncbi:MAG: phytochelatin synthase family protein [Pirellulales bacterium]
MIRTSIVIVFSVTFLGASAWAGEIGRLPLPGSLVEWNSSEGRRLFRESASCQEAFWSVAEHLRPQSNLATCAPTTALIVLNAMQRDLPQAREYGPYPYFTEDNFFTAEVEAIKKRTAVNGSGVTLDQLTKMLRTHGVEADAIHARNTTVDKFEEDLQKTLSGPKQYVISNYFRPALGQKSAGHVSVVVAYHATEHRCLVLDCASFKYPFVWVKTADLFKAMGEQDDESKTSRGYIIVKERASSDTRSSGQVER